MSTIGSPSDKLVAELKKLITPVENKRVRDTLSEIFSKNINFEDMGLQIESDQFLDRVRSSGISLPERFEGPDHKVEASLPVVYASRIDNVNISISALLIPVTVKANQNFSIQIRIKNISNHWLTSNGKFEVKIASLVTETHTSAYQAEGIRNDLMIDLRPGQEMSMPVLLTAPEKPGNYKYRIMPLIEGVAWLEAYVCEVAITSAEGDDPLKVDFNHSGVLRGYMDDHHHSKKILQNWCNDYFAKTNPNTKHSVVEIGGNASPAIGEIKAELFNIDVDAFGLAFGRLRDEVGATQSIEYLVADGTRLPFKDHSIDCIAMFATFHHFPDPLLFLQALKQKLKPDGFIALLCEPIGHVFKNIIPEGFKSELEKGVNEQSFEFWEYREFALRAGLKIEDAIVDVGSIKLKVVNAV